MDKQTLSNYGWLTIVTLILAVMLALATPFGAYIGDAVVSVANGFVGASNEAIDEDNIAVNEDKWDSKFDYSMLENNSNTKYECDDYSHQFDGIDDMTCNLCGKEFVNGYAIFEWDRIGYDGSPDLRIKKTYHEDGVDYKLTDLSSSFKNNSKIKNVWVPNTINTLFDSTFSSSTIETIVFEENATLKELKSTFYMCQNLKSIVIPNSVKSSSYTFYGCSSLTSVSFEENSQIESLGHYDFYNTSIETITLPKSLKRIAGANNQNIYGTFQNCVKLTSVRFEEGCELEMIGRQAFDGCSALESINIPKTVTTIANYAFEDCTSLKDVYYEGTPEEWAQISIGNSNNCLTNATIHYNSYGN